MRIHGREHQRRCAKCAEIGGPNGFRPDVLHLPSAPVVHGHLAAIDQIRIQRVRCDIPIFLDAHRMPLAKRDLSIFAPAGDASRAAFLLSAAQPVRKGIVGRHMVHLRGGLVVPGTPRLAAVYRHHRALIAHQQNCFRIIRIDPDILIIVAARSAANTRPGLPAVRGFPRHGAGHVDDIGILGIDARHWQVAAADTARGTRVGRRARPALPRIVGPKDADGVAVGRCRDQTPGIARSRAHIGLYDAFALAGQPSVS